MRHLLLALALSTTPALADEQAEVLAWVQDTMIAADLAEGMSPTVAIGLADLNADGTNEALIYVMGSSWCGTGGCNLWIMTPGGPEGYEEVAMLTVTNPPIGLLATSTHGWRDLLVTSGDAADYGPRRVRFTGTTYPKNPTTNGDPIAIASATLLITETDGTPLR